LADAVLRVVETPAQVSDDLITLPTSGTGRGAHTSILGSPKPCIGTAHENRVGGYKSFTPSGM
jgi:hypothetical protein